MTRNSYCQALSLISQMLHELLIVIQLEEKHGKRNCARCTRFTAT